MNTVENCFLKKAVWYEADEGLKMHFVTTGVCIRFDTERLAVECDV